ncbi:MAG TPA: ATP-binding protein [Steroidobacteraceae bacterium]|jgi:signal transduction histidine kinase|nr:ATP-binding protein [Steroidobacteraceae bacterium]
MIPGRLPRAIALALALMLLTALVGIAQIGQSGLRQIGRVIGRSQQRQILLAEVMNAVTAAQAGQRGYVLTNDTRQLALYRSARDRVAPALGRLAASFNDRDQALMTREQRPAIAQLDMLTHTKLDELAASLALYVAGGPQQAMTLMRADLRSPTMGRLRDDAATLSEAEHGIVERELARAARLRALSNGLMIGIALLDVLLLVVAAMLLARQARRRAVLTERLARENEELEQRVRRRTSELSSLSSHLQQLSEKEKATLARELHDELGGLLIAVKMDVSWLHKRWPNPAAEIEARWARVLKVLDDGVDFKRRMVENLRPTLLDNMGLLPAVRWITQETCSRAGLQYTEIYPEQAPPLSDDAAIMLFRLVQESLANIVKHAHATHVRVRVEVHEQELTVLIEDNGIGIDTERREAIGSHGLATMRHRVRSCGGSLDIESVPQGGTAVLARLPLAGILKGPRVAEKVAPAADTDPAPARAASSQR